MKASVNKQNYKDFHCIVPREKANVELSKEKLKFHEGCKAVSETNIIPERIFISSTTQESLLSAVNYKNHDTKSERNNP